MTENKHFVTPKTYLLGYTNVDMDQLKQYLSDTDQLEFLEEINTALAEGLDPGEILCSFYAKACYASLTNKKNKNITRTRAIYDNILGILESGHGSVIEHCTLNFMVTN
jgi:thymidylate synthase ThyX